MNVCAAVSRHISLYFVPDFIECFFSFSFLRTWPKTFTQSLMYTHTYPSKSKSQFGVTESASVCVYMCARACFCACVQSCWGWGGGVWLHMHVGVHTCVCALCYQLKVCNVSEVPMFALRPQRKTVQLVESLQYTCTPL